MHERVNRAWRVVATGLSFLAFGVGGLLLGVFVFPSLRLVLRDRDACRRVSRRLVQRSFRCHVELMRVLGVLTYELRGVERLRDRGLLVLANHPTLIDVVFLVSLMDNADCIVKSSLMRNPFMRGPLLACGYIFNDDGAGLIDDCIASLHARSNLVIFPEGTRTRRGAPVRLQRGAANIAVRGSVDVTPVRISCEPMTLGKGERWYRVPPHRFHYSLEVGENIPVAAFRDAGQGSAVVARRLTDYLTQYFS
ncbi:lysophospholipid acyltransferase family protein [Xanthomonadaceae bacterium XH05]|nr:lysophospholipid acyltransferase family protein [Xanthomonadaceae bacterium XH05]